MLHFAFSRLTNDQLYTLALRTKEIIPETSVETLGIGLYYNSFKSAFDEFAKGFTSMKSSAKDVSIKDGIRDDYSRAFVNHIKNFLCYPDADIQSKVKSLLAEIAKHGPGFQRRKYSEETAIIEAILAKIEKEYMDLMEQIFAMVWYNLLKEAQADFEKAVHSQTDKEIEDKKTDAASTVRPDLIDSMRKLYTFLPLQYEMTANAELGKIIEQLKVEMGKI